MLRHRLAAIALVLLVGVAAAVLLPHSPAGLRELARGVGPAAPVIALAAWVVLTPALFPGTVLAAAGGLMFGAGAGTALALAGAVLGGLAAFALARTLGRRAVHRRLERSARLARLHALLERRGFAAVLTARLAPGVPAFGVYYAAGVSPVRARTFAAAIGVGALLRTTPYVLLGGSLASGSPLITAVAVASIAAGSAVALLLLRHLRRPSP